MMPRPMVGVSMCFVGGIIIQMTLSLHWVIIGMLLLAWLISVLLIKKSAFWLRILIVVIAGSTRLFVAESIPVDSLSTFEFLTDSTYQTQAVVLGIGATARGTPKYILNPILIGASRIRQGSIILYAKTVKQVIEVGDTLALAITLNQPRGKRNPNDFDYRKYLKDRHIYFEAFLSESEAVTLKPCQTFNAKRLMANLKNTILQHFHAYLSPRSAGILSALILGEKGDVDNDIRSDFANTGVIHVLAVSGLHVGYVSLILITIFGLLRLPHVIKMSCVVLGLLFYVGLTGGAASVMRASIMASLLIGGGLIERKSDVYNILASAAFIILAIDPNQLQNIGFQLSFLAVLSIVSIFPILKGAFTKVRFLQTHFMGRLLSSILDLFLVSLAAQLGTLAITIFYFHKIPLISLAANLIVVPLIGIIVATGMSFLLLGSCFPILAELWAATLEGTIGLMLWFVQKCAQVDWAFASIRSIDKVELCILLSGTFAITVLSKSGTIKVWIYMLLLWGNIQIWEGSLASPDMELVVLDVGQGDAIVLHTPEGKTAIIDAGLRFGGKDMGKDVLVPYLYSRNWTTIDVLVLTHPHNDHIGGAEYLIKNLTVNRVYMPDIEYESYGYNQLCDTLDSLGIPKAPLFTGTIDSSLAPLYIRTLGPKRYDRSNQPSNLNNTSLILQAFYGESSILLTGDGEEEMEHDQFPFKSLLKSQLIKAPHHGSKTSSTQRYIDMVQASTVLISLGHKNKFRHPAPTTLKRYAASGAKIRRTDEEGALVYLSDGKKWVAQNWKIEN